MKKLLSALLIIFVSQLSSAEKSAGSNLAHTDPKLLDFPAVMPTQTDEETWYHRIFQSVVLDIDNTLQETGIKVEACSYQDKHTKITKSYKALSGCLLDQVFSLDFEGQLDPLFFWVTDKNNKLVPVRLDWNRNEEGWRGILKEVFALQIEGLSRWWMKLSMKQDETQIKAPSFKHNFLGQLKMSLPPGVRLTDIFIDKNVFTMLLKLDQASQISFEMNPTEIKNHQVHYQGQILVSREATLNAAGDIITFDFRTNINLLNIKRPYQTQGKSSGAQIGEGNLK